MTAPTWFCAKTKRVVGLITPEPRLRSGCNTDYVPGQKARPQNKNAIETKSTGSYALPYPGMTKVAALSLA